MKKGRRMILRPFFLACYRYPGPGGFCIAYRVR